MFVVPANTAARVSNAACATRSRQSAYLLRLTRLCASKAASQANLLKLVDLALPCVRERIDPHRDGHGLDPVDPDRIARAMVLKLVAHRPAAGLRAGAQAPPGTRPTRSLATKRERNLESRHARHPQRPRRRSRSDVPSRRRSRARSRAKFAPRGARRAGGPAGARDRATRRRTPNLRASRARSARRVFSARRARAGARARVGRAREARTRSACGSRRDAAAEAGGSAPQRARAEARTPRASRTARSGAGAGRQRAPERAVQAEGRGQEHLDREPAADALICRGLLAFVDEMPDALELLRLSLESSSKPKTICPDRPGRCSRSRA